MQHTILLSIAFYALVAPRSIVAVHQDRDRNQHTSTNLRSTHSKRRQRHPPSCTTCRFPQHSWDTFPVSFHASRPNTYGPTGLEWLPDDLVALARYPLITIEKWHGSEAYSTTVCNTTGNCNKTNVFVWEEDAWIAAAQQIKDINPNISIAVWMDTMLIYAGWSWPPPPSYTDENLNRTLNPDILTPCSTGYFRPAEFLESSTATTADGIAASEFLLKNSSGLAALEPWSNCHIYDYTKQYVRDYWRDLCLNLTSTGFIDGCGADFSALEKNRWGTHTTQYIASAYHLDDTTAEAWNDGHRQMMVETTEALGEGGFLIGKDYFELIDGHVNAVLQEGCPSSNSTITMLRNLTATAQLRNRRLIYQCHTNRPSNSVMAAFLCGAGRDHYLTIGGWISDRPGFPSHWLPEFDRPLGEPLGECRYNTDWNIWTRSFASGTYVYFDAVNGRGDVIHKEDLHLHAPYVLSRSETTD
jgi:hypothetical protein